MKISTILGTLGGLIALASALNAMDSSWNQDPEFQLLDASTKSSLNMIDDRITLNSIENHQYAYDDKSQRIAKLEGVEEPDTMQRRELSFLKSEKDKILSILEKLRERE